MTESIKRSHLTALIVLIAATMFSLAKFPEYTALPALWLGVFVEKVDSVYRKERK